MKKLILILLLLRTITNYYGQCTNQITHTSGTSVIAGTSVTVTSLGQVSTNSVYCTSTNPYYIGYNGSVNNADGSYSFSFTPPVDSITLNFSGANKISNIQPIQEDIILTVNGVHYPFPAQGLLNGCDSIGIITPAGNLTGCDCGIWGSAGWNVTTIIGPISSVTVTDSIVAGEPNGSIFSIYISDGPLGILNHVKEDDFAIIYPNPTQDHLTISFEKTTNGTVIIRNNLGQIVLTDKFLAQNQLVLDLSDIPSGIYFLQVDIDGEVITKKIIKR